MRGSRKFDSDEKLASSIRLFCTNTLLFYSRRWWLAGAGCGLFGGHTKQIEYIRLFFGATEKKKKWAFGVPLIGEDQLYIPVMHGFGRLVDI